MNSSEKRRKELLEQTRRLYSDRREPPAVHPRYGAAYHKLYADENEPDSPAGTFGLRIFLAFLLFAGFVTMDRQEYKVLQVDSDRIVQEIQADTDAAELWKNLSKDISWNK